MDAGNARMLMPDEYSHIVSIRKRKHIILPVFYVTQLSKGVNEVLDRRKKHYDDELDGIIVAFDNVQFTQSHGRIFCDQPVIHWDVEADFYIFRPTVGSFLKAKVNKMSKGHIGCVVHDCFNISLPSTELTTVSIGQEIICEVQSLDLKKTIIRLSGVINEKSLELMKEHCLVVNKSIKFFPNESGEISSCESGIIPDQENASDLETSRSAFENERSTKDIKQSSSKKDKKKKHIKMEIKTEPVSDIEDLNSSFKNKKSKKRKRDSIVEENDISMNESTVEHVTNKSPKHKRRKKDKDISIEIKQEIISDTEVPECIDVGSSSSKKKKKKRKKEK